MHALGSWCERYRSRTGARQSDRSGLWIKTRSALRLYFARSAPCSLHAPLRSHALILITLQMAASHNIKELLICTDSNYARLSFTCHLAGWKQNGFKTANNKPVKHQELFQAGDAIVTEHDIIVYWKKVRGHSRQPGQDKDFNDQTDALAKAGALHGESWTFQALPPNPSVAAITRRQHAIGVQTTTSSHIAISP